MPVGYEWSDFHLATAHLSGNWDKDNPKYRLKFRLACGSEIFWASGHKYQANLKQCSVMLYSHGCEPDFSDPYSYEIKGNVTETTDVSADKEIGGAGTVEAKSVWSRILARFTAGASWKAKSTTKTVETIDIETLHQVISYRGHYWAVGDDRSGDPRTRKPGDPRPGWLRGEYFRENPIKPLCTVELLNKHAKANVMVIVWAQPSQISIYKLGAGDELKREARWGNRTKALEALERKAMIRIVAVDKARRAARPRGLPPIDVKPPSEAYQLDRATLTVQQA